MRLRRCSEIRRHIERNGLSSPLSLTMEEHLTRCKPCRVEWIRLTGTHRLLERAARRMTTPPIDPFEIESLTMRINQEESSRGLPQKSSTRGYAFTVMAGAMAAGALSFPLWYPPDRPHRKQGGISQAKRIGPIPSHRDLDQGTVVTGKSVTSQSVPPRHNEKTSVEKQSEQRVAQANSTSTALPISASSGSRKYRGSPRKTERIMPERLASIASMPAGAKSIVRPDVTGQGTRGAESPVDDLVYLNETEAPAAPANDDHAVMASNLRDDFVTIPLPLLASVPSSLPSRMIAQAVAEHEREKAVVDERLFQKVDLQLKGDDLGELADLLTRKTGVQISVSKDLQDRKLTLFVKETPVRDVMRQVVRLFNLQWRRHGEEGRYRYQLIQSLKQRLEEEELRRKDVDQMFLSVATQVEEQLNYLDLPKEELEKAAHDAEQRALQAQDTKEKDYWKRQKSIMERLLDDGSVSARYDFFGPLQREGLSLYRLLNQEQIVALRNGEQVSFVLEADHPLLPLEMLERWKARITELNRRRINVPGTSRKAPVDLDHPNINPEQLEQLRGRNAEEAAKRGAPPNETTPRFEVTFKIDRKNPSLYTLEAEVKAQATDDGQNPVSGQVGLAHGRPDRVKAPDNAGTHRAFINHPELRKKYTLAPHSDRVHKERVPKIKGLPDRPKNRIDSANFFEELHRKTGRNVIADYYLRLLSPEGYTFEEKTLFDILNASADRLVSTWDAEGQFLRFRRVDHYTERNRDVPNRWLKKWQAVLSSKGSLTLDELAEAAQFPDAQLNDHEMSDAIRWKHGLDEWLVAGKFAPFLRAYSIFDPLQRRAAQSNEGLNLERLTQEQAQKFISLASERPLLHFLMIKEDQAVTLQNGRFYIQTHEPGTFAWASNEYPLFPVNWEVREKTREAAEARVRSLLVSRGLPEEEIKRELNRIVGPETYVVFRMQLMGRYMHGEFGYMTGAILSRSAP